MEISPLNKSHNRTTFDCGEEALNEYLKKLASQHSKIGISKTFVGIDEQMPEKVIGFYSTCVGNVAFDEIPTSIRKLPKYPIPIIRIARLAIDVSMQKKGLGEELLMDGLNRALRISDEIGAVGVVVDAKHEKAKAFYERYGFQELSSSPLSLIISFEQIKRAY